MHPLPVVIFIIPESSTFPPWRSPVTKSRQNAPPEEQTPLCGIILSQNRLPSAPWWQASAGAK